MKTRTEIVKEVLEIIKNNIEIDVTIEVDKSLSEVYEIDSYTLLNILVDIEDRFGFTFDVSEDLDAIFYSVEKITDYLTRRV